MVPQLIESLRKFSQVTIAQEVPIQIIPIQLFFWGRKYSALLFKKKKKRNEIVKFVFEGIEKPSSILIRRHERREFHIVILI